MTSAVATRPRARKPVGQFRRDDRAANAMRSTVSAGGSKITSNRQLGRRLAWRQRHAPRARWRGGARPRRRRRTGRSRRTASSAANAPSVRKPSRRATSAIAGSPIGGDRHRREELGGSPGGTTSMRSRRRVRGARRERRGEVAVGHADAGPVPDVELQQRRAPRRTPRIADVFDQRGVAAEVARRARGSRRPTRPGAPLRPAGHNSSTRPRPFRRRARPRPRRAASTSADGHRPCASRRRSRRAPRRPAPRPTPRPPCCCATTTTGSLARPATTTGQSSHHTTTVRGHAPRTRASPDGRAPSRARRDRPCTRHERSAPCPSPKPVPLDRRRDDPRLATPRRPPRPAWRSRWCRVHALGPPAGAPRPLWDAPGHGEHDHVERVDRRHRHRSPHRLAGAARNTRRSNAKPASAAASTPSDGTPTAATHPSAGTTPAASVIALRNAAASSVGPGRARPPPRCPAATRSGTAAAKGPAPAGAAGWPGPAWTAPAPRRPAARSAALSLSAEQLGGLRCHTAHCIERVFDYARLDLRRGIRGNRDFCDPPIGQAATGRSPGPRSPRRPVRGPARRRRGASAP